MCELDELVELSLAEEARKLSERCRRRILTGHCGARHVAQAFQCLLRAFVVRIGLKDRLIKLPGFGKIAPSFVRFGPTEELID
jgi:hypothetical protein